ncbi:hypothetical protein lerEdw1_005212 [Lerista edwardsae]|nr:hypothetical protein lerEdw1_005212 [Lerista edwardsae]
MSSGKRGGAKCRKSKKGSSLNPTRLVSGLGNLGERTASDTSIPSSLPSTSAMALALQTAAASSCPNSGHSLPEAAAPLGDDGRMEQEDIQREHCEEAIDSVDPPNQIRTAASEVEPIELDENAVEVVDLTCESSETVVVDLTHNDSVMFVEENRQGQNQELRNQLSDSCVLSSDDDSEPRESNKHVTRTIFKIFLVCVFGYNIYNGRTLFNRLCPKTSLSSPPWPKVKLPSPIEEAKHHKEIVQKVNELIATGQYGRLFAVVHFASRQWKITSEDLILIENHIPAECGDRIRMEKVLLVGADDFTLLGKPLLGKDLVRVEATVIEKTESWPRINMRFKRRRRFQRKRIVIQPQTILRINTIEIAPVLS